MAIRVLPISLFTNTSVTYDQTKTSRIGQITNKTISGETVMGPPLAKYRNTVLGSEALTPNDLHFTENNRIFVTTTEAGGLVQIALYDINPLTNDISYVGKLNITVNDSPATTHVIRGFRVADAGVTGWKLFWLSTANQLGNEGLYMANDIALTDFSPVPVTIPTATAGGQKAVYRLHDGSGLMTAAAGLSLDTATSHAYVHNGVSATHQYYKFNYAATITTVTAGSTTDAFVLKTGNLPALSGTLIVTNSEEYHLPGIGPNIGQPCVIFNTTTNMYRGRLSELTAATTAWPSLEFQNNNPGNNLITAENTSRCAFSDTLKKVVLLTSNNVLIVKSFLDNVSDLYTVIEGRDNDENTVKDIYTFRVGTVQGFDSRNGMVAILSTTTGQRGLYVSRFDTNNVYDTTHIISPVQDVTNLRLLRATVGLVRQDRAAPVYIYYRTSGFGTATGGWVLLPSSLLFAGQTGIISPTGQIQLKIGFSVFESDKANPIQLNSFGIIYESLNTISDNLEYTHDDSSPGSAIVAFRLKKAYASVVPTLFFRAYDLTGTLVVQSDTSTDAGLFEYSTDDGANWNSLGVIPNFVGTKIRYTFAVAPGIDVRPSMRES